MATRIRTLDFLPEIFKTPTNSQFLQATLDQLTAQPNIKKIEGYIGSKFGYGINANDYYVTEPTKVRTDYQLDPGVVFLKEDTSTATDFISYPGMVDSLTLQGGVTNNNNRLFNSEFYSWDSFTNLDKIINFNQYYWLPTGPERVVVTSDIVYNSSDYVVISTPTEYLISSETLTTPTANPSLTLLRGGTYTFTVNQDTEFWIQGQPGVTGYSPTQPNVQTRNVYGVTNNGASIGTITFTVPEKNALDEYNFPTGPSVDVVSNISFNELNGAFVNDIGGIDGITALDGLTVMFYDTGILDEIGYVEKFYDQTLYDQETSGSVSPGGGVPYDNTTDYPGTSIFNYNYEGGYYTTVNANFYTITLLGDQDNPQIQLTPSGTVPTNLTITPNFGDYYANLKFYRNTSGYISLVPYNSAILDTLYYQDGTNPNKVGAIRLITSNITNTINVVTQILGKSSYTSPNGVVFTNGLKVLFQGDIYPESYNNIEYYVEGVGDSIELIPVTTLVTPGLFSEGTYIPFDTTPYDVGNYDISLNIPTTADYITIARNAINKNAWSRSNRWFHIAVITATAEYNNTPALVTQLATLNNKAKRPIIEFYPNLRLFDSGVYGKAPVDFMDTRTTDAFSYVAGQPNYYPDTAGYTNSVATIAPVTGALTKTATATVALLNQVTLSNTTGIHVNDTITFTGTAFGGISTDPTNKNNVYYILDISGNNVTISKTKQGTPVVLTTASGTMSAAVYPYSTSITVPTTDVFGLFSVGQYITDSTNLLPSITFVTNVTVVGSNTIITVSWDNQSIVYGTSVASVVTADTPLDNYALFDGSRIVFAADTNLEVRNKIYISHFSTISGSTTPIITLTEASDGAVLLDEQTAVYRGYNNKGSDFYFDGLNWYKGQQKTNVNQPPLFDIFDKNGISFGNKEYYIGTSFVGSKLFSYGIGSGSNDSVLGFPLRYSSVDNVGDISFDVTLNSQTFNYVTGTKPITQNVNTGYVYNYTTNTDTSLSVVKQLGWQAAVSPSVQYQIFEFDYNPLVTVNNTFTCDIAAITDTNWPPIQVYINNNYVSKQKGASQIIGNVTTVGIDPQTILNSLFPDATTGDAVLDNLSGNLWVKGGLLWTSVGQMKGWITTNASTDTTTEIYIPNLGAVETVVQILILSDQVSETAYYQTPINLNNNPLNQSITTANIGDIRGQYQSIFYNNPNTTGEVFGSNNYRDLGNLVPWGNRIIQNSAALVLPGIFLRKPDHNLFDALMFNSYQYINFKALLINTVNDTAYSTINTPAEMLDGALDIINAAKTQSESFFWGDMLPSKSPYITNTYSFANSLDISIYPLSKIYNFATANYSGVLVYLTRDGEQTQLVKGVDYTISTDSPSLTITVDLLANDTITINEYNQTYGNFVPNTPTKLGLYPATIPSVTLDTAYSNPTYFIVGHDGSFNKLYGSYNSTTGSLTDFRDQVLLEYETRVYNNLKLSETVPAGSYQGVVIPGFFRQTDYSYDEFLQIYSETFLNWVGKNRIDYKTQLYNVANEYTYNYRDSGNRINQQPLDQGYFRGLYLYFYDTSTPDQTPWEMLGLSNKPSWWETRYGPAPYTSDNLVLWNDLSEGLVWNNGNSFIKPNYARSNLLEIIPVDSYGNLVSPFVSIVGNYDDNLFKRDWIIGDVGPAEFSYRRSSTWPFDLMRILAVTKPADFFNLGVDVDNYKYNIEFNQYLVNDRSHLVLSNIPVYGNGTAATSYINWVVDYEKQVGIDATTNITTLLNNVDVRLVYRLAGFSDQSLLKFFVEKSSANSNNSSLLIPDESYDVLLYENQPFDKIVYSGVVIQISEYGFKVFGNSQTNAYFKVSVPADNGNVDRITVQGATVTLPNTFTDKVELIPYGFEFYNLQEVSVFLTSYGNYLKTQGMLFNEVENGIPVTWTQMVGEFLYWAQTGWEIGSITTINPSANLLAIDKDSYIVQPLTLRQLNFVLNQNLYPIQSNDLAVVRDNTLFTAAPLNVGDSISYGQFNISNIEHGIVFNNVTLFNDVIYNLITGLRQNRIYVRGTKTADWNGTLDAYGFILNQDNIKAWDKNIKYTTGSIIKYKNKYWTALTIVQPKEIFDEREWKQTPYNEIQKGLLPNSQTRSYESTLYYDTNNANLENDGDLLSFSLIGYRPRDYMTSADLTDVTQVNVYQNLIKEKGTKNAASAFRGATLAQGGINYDLYENWAIKSGEFGGVLNSNFVEIPLQESVLTGNPSIVGLTNGVYTAGVQQEVPLYSITNYGRPINSPNILPTIASDTPSTLLPTAGYVNFNDVKMASYFYSGLANAVNASGTVIPINQFYVRDYVWLANYLSTWQVFTPASLGSIVNAKNNLNNTVTITFSQAHNLVKYQVFAIVNFNASIDNYYSVAAVVDPFNVIIGLSLDPSIRNVTGLGVGFRMQTQRVATAPEIINLPLLDNEFNKLKVWVDTNNDGSWAVYRKSINYQYNKEITNSQNSQEFGSAVAYTSDLGYLIADSGVGSVYRYRYYSEINSYSIIQTITQGSSFGSNITYSDDIFIISEPTGAKNVYVYQLITTALVNDLELIQTIPYTDGTGVTNWGSSTALSGDKNWLYISDIDNNSVYVYRKSAVTGLYVKVHVIDGDTLGLTSSGDNFGYSISTDYYGDSVVIGAPKQDYSTLANYGYSYVFSRLVQNFTTTNTSQLYIPSTFDLAWSPDPALLSTTANTISSNYITLGSVSGLSAGANGTPIVFTGTPYGGISANTVYYVKSIVGSTISVSLTRNGTALTLTNSTGTMTAVGQTYPLFVTVNGTTLADNYYAIIGSTLNVYSSQTPTLNAGDILNVSGMNFVLTQTLDTEQTPETGVQFGNSVDTNKFASEILIGAPFELDSQNHEGAVYRYTNGGESYGVIIGTADCLITTPRTILLNGYAVVLQAGNASAAVQVINQARVTNITASEFNGKLLIQLIDNALGTPNNKLSLTAVDSATFAEMGIDVYAQTQTINCPHLTGTTQFGSKIKFDKSDSGSFIASAPTGTRFSATTFDFIDDELDNDTVFDNNATQWVDTFTNAGAVYMFDYLSAYNENLSNPGKFVYAQSTNALNIDYGSQPMYGTALDFNENTVTVGAQNFNPTNDNIDMFGQVITYISSSATPDWTVYRYSSPIVDVNGIGPIQLYSASTNETLINLDYFDPMQGKLLGAVQENIDVISNTDPARYNNSTDTQGGLVWGADKVGQIWLDTSSIRFMNYHQNDDVSYNSRFWGRVFPGSNIAVYSWISSNVPPAQYTGPGVPLLIDTYSIQGTVNAEGLVVPIYFFWARNTNIVFETIGKTLADSTLELYIAQPQGTGISYLSPFLPNVFGLYNCSNYINAFDTRLHLGYTTSNTNDDPIHNQYSLIRENYADDFLPGLPENSQSYSANTSYIDAPTSLYNKLLDSMCGVDISGAVVPNPLLPKLLQTGVMSRPRQGFFYNRFGALKNYLQYANAILAQFPITESRSAAFLSTSGVFFNTKDYWNYINWWATGYNNNTKAALQVPIYADLATLNVATGTIVSVLSNSTGNSETYIYNGDTTWTRIGLENGTIEFSSYLWDYSAAKLGFGDNFFDTNTYDEYPSEETRYIVRALNEEIYTNELLINRNKSLILLFDYIQSETAENQNYLPWLNKTSLVDVSHTIRELLPLEVFRSDNQIFLEGYINEVKPYHVVIKDFLFKYTKTDIFEGDITDFDLPSEWNSTYQQFISPQLVYSNPSDENQYLPNDPIWQTAQYNQWFNNYGLSVGYHTDNTITGEQNYPITLLTSYVSLNSSSLFVENVSGFPVTGTILIGTELIGYAGVNLLSNQLTGLSRGRDNTITQVHLPGEQIYIDLPAVIVLNSGRNYAEPPRVTAYIDTTIYPAPRVPAQLAPIMALDKVIGVEVINPGEGYAVLPTINIDPAFTVVVDSSAVDIINDTIEVTSAIIQTGDIAIYQPAADSTKIGGLYPRQRYYIRVLETTPSKLIAFYESYINLNNDHDRVLLTSTGSGNQYFSIGAIASCITSSIPIRENTIKLRFDRTSYTSQVNDWVPGSFYGSFYAGSFNDSTRIASSSILLPNTQEDASEPVKSILASNHGVVFEILDVENLQTSSWSSRTRDTIQTYGPATSYPNAIRINPSEGGSAVDLLLGSTLGFYVGMPIKFEGEVPTGSPITNYTTYYVKSLVKLPNITVDSPYYGQLENTGFTISTTIDGDGVPGSVLTLTTATVPAAGLTLYVGEVTNNALLTINYDGIRTATATTAGTNTITVPLTPTGLGGTTNFYPGLIVFFTGDVFGQVIENEHYYVTTVIDLEHFTMSATNTPTILDITATSSVGSKVTCNSTLALSVNEPIIFTGAVFGNIVAGTTYYIREIFSGNTTFSISESINGSLFVLTTDTGSCTCTSQADTVVLTTVPTTSGKSMTLNVGIPVSPGQINGQELTFYGSGGPYVGVSGTASNLLTREITSTLTSVNRICLSAASGGITNIYNNMNFNVASNIGGLTTSGGPYTVVTNGVTSITVTNTSGTGNWLTLPIASNPNTTSILYVGMPIYFSGVSLGGVSLNTVYYVYSIDGSPPANTGRFKIADAIDSVSPVTVSNDNGIMTGTGETYITVSNSLSTQIGPVTLTQAVGSSPTFNVSYTLGGYSAVPSDLGSGYAVNNIITILGTDIGGTTTTNDLSYQVLTINSTGGVLTGVVTGTPAGNEQQYYVKVYSENQIELYSNPELTAAVTGQNFPYTGITLTTATQTVASTDRITVGSSASFNINDPVVFTGAVFGNIVLGDTYYIKSKPTSTTVTVAETIGGSTFQLADETGSMTMAKTGDYTFLPEPFFFNSSIVKFNNQVYQCIISNNDQDFIVGKWELLTSSSSKLNALDRIIGYYQPTVNMPGVDLTQLVTGITYPNSTYLGNAFAPADEYPLDTILIDQPFYQTGINLKTIIWNGTVYLAGADLSTYSSINISADAMSWDIAKLANQPINVTDFIFAGGRYVITSNNSATPILVSDNGYSWITNGLYTPYSSVGWDDTTFDISSILAPSLSLNSVAYYNGIYVAVGNNIISSTDLYTWTERYSFPSTLPNNVFNGVAYVSTAGFTGFIAVGLGQTVGNNNALLNVSIIFTSTDGYTWTQIPFGSSTFAFNAITSNGQTIVAVGNNGIIYTSFNATTWFAQSSGTVRNLNSIIWNNDSGLFVVVGDNGTILTAGSDGGTWTPRTSGVSYSLQSIVWNNANTEYVAVGYNNTVLRSSNVSTWTASSTFVSAPSVYSVQGSEFTDGYGPEEMVPGVVTDTITMITNTRPGTNWDETIYQHVGYTVVSLEISPTSGTQKTYSFADAVTTPAQLGIFVISYITGLSTSLYEGIDYTINWITKTVTLENSITFVPNGISDKLRIDLYEVGNGDQLVKANTETDPIRYNTSTTFSEIYINANFTAEIYQGSGVVRPSTQPIVVTAIETNSVSNAITCTEVNDFVLNSPVRFSGAVFGNIVEDQIYYVKSISSVSSRITISETYNTTTGTAGSTFELASATGSMAVIIQTSTAQVWTEPSVFHNGTALILGTSENVLKTNSITNTITTVTTSGLIPNTPIVFSNQIFGGIAPKTTYYIKTIYDANEFTISATPGGTVFPLTDATGGAIFITNDYAIGMASNGINASIMFPVNYDATVDYITYTLMGQTIPIQYGYTLPQTQFFTGNGSASSFNLTNYMGGTNPNNAIVEVNGVRQNKSAYTINSSNNTLLFTNTPPANGDVICVTSYNLTDRQYLNSQYNVTGINSIASITVSNTTATGIPFDYGILAGSFVVGQRYTIQSLNDNAYPTPGANTDFTAIGASSNTVGVTFTATGAGTGTGSAIIAGDGFDATVQSAGSFILGQSYTIVTLGTTTNTQWNTIAGTSAITYSVGSTFTCANIGTGLGTGTAYTVGLYSQSLNYLTLASGSTSSLVLNSAIVFENVIGGIIAGQTYYITQILNSTDFVISTQVGGVPYEVTTASGAMTSVVKGLTVSPIVGVDSNISNQLRIGVSGTVGATDYVTCDSTAGMIVGQDIVFQAPVFAINSALIVTYQYEIVSLGNTTQLEWNDAAGTSGIDYAVGDRFTAATTGVGTGTVFLSDLGGISTLGQIYYVREINIDGIHFSIENQEGDIINLSNSSSTVIAFMGGLTAVRIVTGIDNNFTQNQIVRLDGLGGSVQLNNNTYYARIISNTEFDLYNQPYVPYYGAANSPVTNISAYTSGGYAWLDQLFTIVDTTTISTKSSTNRIVVDDATMMVSGTPVYFTQAAAVTDQNILSNIKANHEYYVLDATPITIAGNFVVGLQYQILDLGTTTNTQWNTIAGTSGVTYQVDDIFTAATVGTGTGSASSLQEFTITDDRYPNESEVVLTNATGVINVTQFQQVNVDRLWVTVNGYRVPSSSLRLNAYNNLSILTTIQTGDVVIITSMMPTATPNEETYLLNVNTTNQAVVYRANTQTRTWLTSPLSYTDDTIYVNDLARITDSIVQNNTCPAIDLDTGTYLIGLISNKNTLCHLVVYNDTTGEQIDPIHWKIVIIDTAPVLQITNPNVPVVTTGDLLTITSIEGRILYLNGEQIGFSECDLAANTVTQLFRGANGTGVQNYIPKYSEVFGLTPNNKMTSVLYSEVWNPIPGVYNTVEGDPLQIADTQGANFLRGDIN